MLKLLALAAPNGAVTLARTVDRASDKSTGSATWATVPETKVVHT
jgi:hypothetical protein